MKLISHFKQAAFINRYGETLHIREVTIENEKRCFTKIGNDSDWTRYEDKLENGLTVSNALAEVQS